VPSLGPVIQQEMGAMIPYMGQVADLHLPLLPLSTVPLELSSSDLELTIYCDDLVDTVPYLRHFAALVVSQTLVKHQIFKEYLFCTYPSRRCACHVT